MVKEFYENAIFDGDELKCWVWGKVTPSDLAIILNINWPVFQKPPMYDDLDSDVEMLRDAFGENLEIASNGKSIVVSSLSPELKLLTTIMFHNLYQALDTWILVRPYFFMTWSLMKKLIFAHISSTFWARLLRERPQGIAFLFVASFQKFWSSKAFTHWKMSTFILNKAQSTFALSMLS